MAETNYRWKVGISYHTRTDSELASALIEALASIDVQGLSLPYLNVSGYSVSQPDNPERWRKDGWVNHFKEFLEESIGLIIVSTAESMESEETPWRGIWIERNLADCKAQTDAEFIFRLEHPSTVKLISSPTPKPEALRRLLDELDDLRGSTGVKYDAAQDRIAYLENLIDETEALLPPPASPPPQPPIPDPKDWVRQVLPILKAWVDRRQNEHTPKRQRFESALVNDKGYFDPIEVGRTFGRDFQGNIVPGTFYWFFIAVLDLYDCVWICRRCFSISDVWMRTESRPPSHCPNCDFTGRQYT